MVWLSQLLVDSRSTSSAVLALALVVFLGLAIGNIRYRGIKLGVAGILFIGLLFGHFGLHPDPVILEFVREFGLLLFVYAVGSAVGPGFFNALKAQGWRLNALAAAVVLLGLALTVGLSWIGNIARPIAVGIFSGATTNTPSLGAAGQTLRERPPQIDLQWAAVRQAIPGRASELQAIPDEAERHALLLTETVKLPSLSYAVTYPFGVFGMILALIAIRWAFRGNPAKEAEELEAARRTRAAQLERVNLRVTNPNLAGVRLQDLPALDVLPVVISRVGRGAEQFVAQPDWNLQLGDVLLAVGPPAALKQLQMIVGDRAEVDLLLVPSALSFRWVAVTHKKLAGQTLENLRLSERHNVQITRVRRAEVELPPDDDFRLSLLDHVRVVGSPDGIAAVAAELGDTPRELETPELIPAFVGLALGVVLGACPLWLPGLPTALKLGMAGGPLVVAIILSRYQRLGSLVWYLPTSANLLLRDLGIALFLAAVGLKGGDRFIATLVEGAGVWWMCSGFLVTLLPLVIVGAFAQVALKMRYLETVGLLAGAMTDPPALAFVQAETTCEAPSVAYATVYPLSMILRILCAQLLVLT